MSIDTLGARLRRARRTAELTQDQLAQKAGTNQAVIQKIENGKSQNPRCVEELAQVLGVNPAWLHYGDTWAVKERNWNQQAA